MNDDLFSFDMAEDFSDAPKRSLIPAGNHTALIESATVETTKNGGKKISLAIQIIEGDSKGRKIWPNLNIINKTPAAVQIAKRNLKAIFQALGVQVTQPINDLAILAGMIPTHKALVITVAIQKTDWDGSSVVNGKQNEVTGYSPVGGVVASAPSPSAAPQPTAPQQPVAKAESDQPVWAQGLTGQ